MEGEGGYKMMRLAVILSIFFFLAGGGAVIAEVSQHKHEHSHHATTDMEKQHKTMADMGMQWAEMSIHLSNRDLDKMKNEVDAMLETAKNIPNFMLHKNPDKKEDFLNGYKLLKRELGSLRDGIKTKDIENIEKLTGSVNEACNRCHDKFR